MMPNNSKSLPAVHLEQTADEEKFDCPQPWYLALLTAAMSAMTSITVAGALFFLLAAPEKVSPHCYTRTNKVTRMLCTASTVCFWTYPVVCCLFVVLVYAKNLVDQRLYYEFLLHKVVIGYGRVKAWKLPIVLMLLLYALCAFSALVWQLTYWHGMSQSQIEVSHVYSSLAYITPIISFLAVILAQWSIQGKLVTLPNFLDDYHWAVKHLNASRCYYVDDIHAGYRALEMALEKTDEGLDTPRLVALVEHYTLALVNQRCFERLGVQDIEAKSGQPQEVTDIIKDVQNYGTLRTMKNTKEKARQVLSEAEEKFLKQFAETPEVKECVYWQVRLLFNPRLQDDRSQNFRNWALVYMITVILAVVLSIYLYVCCLITCLEIERVLFPGTPSYAYTHRFSLRQDLAHANHKSLKQMAASAALSFINNGARAFYSRATGALPHFQLGAAA